MKIINRKLCIYILVLFINSICVLQAQWVQTNGPHTNKISCLTGESNNQGTMRIYVGTYGEGIYSSTDKGISWTSINNGLVSSYVYSLVIHNNRIYAGCSGGICYSTDKGANWITIRNGLHYYINQYDSIITYDEVYRFFVTPNRLYTETSSGLYSLDYSDTTWIKVGSNYPIIVGRTPFAVISTNILLGTYNGIYISTDNGTNWDTTFSQHNTYSFAVNGNIVFAGTCDGIYLSVNGGTTWNKVKNTNNCVYQLAINDTGLYAWINNEGIFLSTDNGTTWNSINNDLPISNISHLTINGNNVLVGTQNDFARNLNAIYFSRDNGVIWSKFNCEFGHTSIFALSSNYDETGNTNIFAGTLTSGFYRSTNNGKSWTNLNEGLISNFIEALTVNGNNVFAGINGSGVFISTNNGTNWSEVNIGLTNRYVMCLLSEGANLFAGTDGDGVFLSTNNGTNWSKISNGLPTYTKVLSLVIDSPFIYAGTIEGVFMSTNIGLSWNAINNGLPYTPTEGLDYTKYDIVIRSLALNGENLFAGTYKKGIFLSTNNGSNWTAINNGLPNNCDVWSFALSDNNLFASTDSGRVYLTTNNGNNWTLVNSGLPNTYITTLIIRNNDMYAGTDGNGVWRRPINEMITDIKNTQNSLPEEFSLNQNFPNPFNPTTTFSFNLPNSCRVVLTIYDILGKEVTKLIDEEKGAGNYRIKYDALKLSSGIYFYQIKAGNFMATKKFVLIK